MCLMLSVLLGLFINPIHDPDFWWHLKSGQWIWEHRAIPETDPFSFTTYDQINPAPEPRIKYILTQYWLSQPLFYLAWKLGGASGVIALRAGILLLSVLLGYRYLLRKGVSVGIASALSLAAGLHLTIFTNERPQLFSFLFMVLYYVELEALKDGGKRGIVTLPLISLVWANMHSSGLMSWLPAAFCLLEAVHSFLRKQPRAAARPRVLAAVLLGICLTLASPNTYHVFSILREMQGTEHLRYNSEFLSPLVRFKDMGHIYPAYWTLMALSATILFSRHMDIFRRLFVVSLMLLSLNSMRFTPFFVLMAPLLVGQALQKTLAGRPKTLALAPLVAAGLLAAGAMYQFRGDLFTLGVNHDDYPAKAARFASDRAVEGRMLNFFEWGGYLMWHLPGKQTFTDGRVLRLDVWDEYLNTVITPRPEWSGVLEKYKIGFVLLPLASPATGQPPELIFLLLSSADWKAVYVDDLVVIITRSGSPGSAIPRDSVISAMLAALKAWADKEPDKADRWARIATAYYYGGDKASALRYFRKAQQLDPANPSFSSMVDLLQMVSPEGQATPPAM